MERSTGQRDRQSGRGLSIEFFRARRIEPGDDRAALVIERELLAGDVPGFHAVDRRRACRDAARLLAPSLVSDVIIWQLWPGDGGIPGADDIAGGDVGRTGGGIGRDRRHVGRCARCAGKPAGSVASPGAAGGGSAVDAVTLPDGAGCSGSACVFIEEKPGARAAGGKQRCQRNRDKTSLRKSHYTLRRAARRRRRINLSVTIKLGEGGQISARYG